VTPFSILPFATAISSLLLAVAAVLRKKRSPAAWCFFAGMCVLASDALFTGLSLRATRLHDAIRWLTLGLLVKAAMPAPWLAFSLTYSRGDCARTLSRWRVPLVASVCLPLVLALGFRDDLLYVTRLDIAGQALRELRFGVSARALNLALLVALVLILLNLEQTFRSAVGTMRWRIKFMILGLGVVFGAHLYVRIQSVLFPVYDVRWTAIESSGLSIGLVFLMLGYARARFAEIDVYPSRAVLRSSLTLLVVSAYLFVVGVLAQIVRHFGGAESFQLQAFVVLLGMAGVMMLLLSDRLRQRIHRFVGRHFSRAQHDSVQIWTESSRRLANVKDQAGLCSVSASLISEIFDALSVSIWIWDEHKQQMQLGASTASRANTPEIADGPLAVSPEVAAALRGRSSPFDLERVTEPWAEEFRQFNSLAFKKGGSRWCVPLRASTESLGAIVLADRVNGAEYTIEELELLQCIANQVTSVLFNLRLAYEVAQATELEAFRTMSAFFVHDLKNAAASLNLMLKNLPAHFDDPAFRDDALRGIGNTARRIDEMIARLTALRQRPDFRPVDADLNQVVDEALDKIDEIPHVELTKDLRPLPTLAADREQIKSVVTNLVLNARDAVGPEGRIQVRTEHAGDSVVLSVTDDGCGMSAAFIKESLFRPFQTTKRKGLGIGMFQSRRIVEAHGGTIRVESETGKGTTFQVSLPVKA
jgi:putative PEP-CTERM system histidine kinase